MMVAADVSDHYPITMQLQSLVPTLVPGSWDELSAARRSATAAQSALAAAFAAMLVLVRW